MTSAFAHPVSASHSELTAEDGLSRLTIHLPLHELEHLPQAQRNLARYFQVAGGGPVSERCAVQGNEWVCRATFLGTPGTVECRLAEVTVPHHIHTMRTSRGTLVFTGAVTRQDGAPTATWPLWIFAAVLLGAVLWFRRNLRSRQNLGA